MPSRVKLDTAAFKSGPIPKRRNWRKLPNKRLTRAEKNMKFVETHCRVPEGEMVGEAVHLAPFQENFFYAVYDNKVLTRTAILSMARKNAKTATIAFIVLVHLVGPEAKQNSRINSGARSRKQASEVFNYASKCVQLSPTLRPIVKETPSHKKLTGRLMNTEYEALAAEGASAHGGSPIVAILDEVGQVKGPTDPFVDAIITSQGAYENPLLIIISTQAPTDADMMSIMIDDAIRSDDPSIVCHLYTADKTDAEGGLISLTDRKQWAKANPAMGLFRSEADIADKADKATRMPSAENAFRVLFLNQRVNMVSAFVSASTWRGNSKPAQDDVFLAGPVYGGLDLSATTDLTSLVLTVRDTDGMVHVRPYFWMPQLTVLEASARDRAPYDVWVREGLIRTCPGTVIDYDFVAKDILGLVADLPMSSVAFDPWRMDRMKSAAERQGLVLPFVPFIQGFKSFTPALDALETDLLHHKVRHGGNPVLGMCAANAVAVIDPAGNRKLDKSKSNGRIDGMVALAMAEGVEARLDEDKQVDILSMIV